jgi:hypothetical protein
MIAAARLPARKLSANSQSQGPMAIGRLSFSTQLLSRGRLPSPRYHVSATHRPRL